MEKKNIQQFVENTIDKVIKKQLNEETINDFFNFLEQDPQKKSFAYVYYTSPVKLNKNYVDENGVKLPNPMVDKLFKNQQIKFNYGATYKEAVLKQNPEHEFKDRKGNYEKVQGFDVLEMGKSGLYLPVLPIASKSTYSIKNDDGSWEEVNFEDVKQFFPPQRERGESETPQVRQLIVDRIARVSAKGNVWTNPHFIYKYLGPKQESFT